MKIITVICTLLIFLVGCSSKPSDSEIKKLIFTDDYNDIVRYDSFIKTDGFQKDDKTYIADIQYVIISKKSAKEMMQISKDDGPMGSAAAIYLLLLYGADFERGATVALMRKVTLIKKENGWDIENIEDTGMQRIITKAEQAAMELRAKEEAILRKQQEEQEKARRGQEEAKRRQVEAKIQADEKEWAKAQRMGTDEGYSAYIKNNPEGQHRAEANNIIDNNAWEAARKENTIESYTRYLNSSSNGRHRAEASKILGDSRDRVEKLTDVPELSWNTVLGLRATTLNAKEDAEEILRVRDAYISLNDCDSWTIARNEVQKESIRNKAEKDLMNMTNSMKGAMPVRVRFSLDLVLKSYDYSKQAFMIGECRHSGGGLGPGRVLHITSQHSYSCAGLRPVKDELFLEIEKSSPNMSLMPMAPQAADALAEKLKQYKQCRQPSAIASVHVEIVAKVRAEGHRGSMYASLIAVYVWENSNKDALIGVLGNAASDSAFK